jgi:site-specific DNA recombinase
MVQQPPVYVRSDEPQCTAIVYCRVSHENQRRTTASLTTQAMLGCELAAQQGLHVLHVTEEVASGASLWSRPLLARDRAALLTGRAQVLIVANADRLTRNFVHLALMLDSCARVGASVLSVNEHLPVAQDVLLLRDNAQDFARLERERIRDRMVQGKAGRALAGNVYRAGIDKYGYRRDTQRGVRLIHEPEAQVVRQIFSWVTLDNLSYTEVARRLNVEGILPPSAGKMNYRDPERVPRWGVSQIRRMLTDPAYKGQAIAWRWKYNGRHHNPHERPADEQIPLPDGVIPAIVSLETWDSAQARSVASQQAYHELRQKAQRYLLTGCIWCAVCGRRMQAEPHSGEPVYRCSSRRSTGGACGVSQVHAPAVEAWTWQQVQRILAEPARLMSALEHQRTTLHNPLLTNDREIMQNFAAMISERQERVLAYLQQFGSDAVSAELVQRELVQLEYITQQVEATHNELDALLGEIQQPVMQLETLLASLSTKEQDTPYSLDEQQVSLQALGVRVVANGRRWQLHCDVFGDAALVAGT